MMGKATVEITDANFDADVLQSTTPVLIDFWADWCGPCHMVAPAIEEIATENAGKLVVGKVDVDHNPQTARKYQILSIPSMILFVDGVEKVRVVGARPKEAILSEISSYL
jgi:thioredoxin 1